MYNPFKSFWNQNPASICFDATCNSSLDIHARSLIFQQWNYSIDVILKLFNSLSLLFWSFCVSLSWTYIVLNGLNKSRLIIGKQKPGKILINKSSVIFSWIRMRQDVLIFSLVLRTCKKIKTSFLWVKLYNTLNILYIMYMHAR